MNRIIAMIFLLNLCSVWQCVHADNAFSQYDPAISVFWFQKKMATKGSPAAQYKLGTMYETGTGIPRNLTTAKMWYQKAAEQNYKSAKNRLVFLSITQKGFSAEHEDWLKTLRHDARFGDGEALFLLAQLHSSGTGVEQNKERALKLLKKAAAADIAGAEAERIKIEDQLKKMQAAATSQHIKNNQQVKKTPSITPLQRNKQLKIQQQALQQAAIQKQQKALSQYYQRLKQSSEPLIQQNNTASKNINKTPIDSTNKYDVCSGSHRFVASCR